MDPNFIIKTRSISHEASVFVVTTEKIELLSSSEFGLRRLR